MEAELGTAEAADGDVGGKAHLAGLFQGGEGGDIAAAEDGGGGEGEVEEFPGDAAGAVVGEIGLSHV